MHRNRAFGAFALVALLTAMLVRTPVPVQAEGPRKLALLLLGDKGHHRPADFARLFTPALAGEGITVTYTDDVAALSPEGLARYDAVAIFRDSGELPAKQEAALLDFVDGGKGLVAVHCASHCFRNSSRYTALVGGRFLRHGTGVFRARIVDAQHPAVRGVSSFECWDETYVHDQIADDIRVLQVRSDEGRSEPYTWVRDQGKGRVFYTAHGHDERCWKTPGFQKMLAQGIRWAAGRVNDRPDLKPLEFVEADVPNYLPGRQWGTTGAPIRKMQKPLEPAESMKHMHLPEGFEVQLYAAEPDIAKPIAMAWDARGRLWIAETVDYPNDRQPVGRGHDRITICEDTDGDGRADKFTVFADKLSIPTGLAFAGGGLVVVQAPDTLFLKDTHGDGHADVRRVLFSGWGTHDTHAGPSNLRIGLDNWVWGTVGYSGFQGKVGGKEHSFGQGVFRFKPDGSELEFLASTNNNTWGLGLGESGDVFGSTANNQHSFQLAVPNRFFEGVRGWYGQGLAGIEDHKRIHPISKTIRQVDVHGGFTAAAGHALYTARAFPADYWNQTAFVCEPTGHVVHTNRLVSRGSGFVARDGWNLFASDDEWTAPIMAEVGPDGSLWVIDWYNFIVQHNPTPAGFKTGKGGAYVTRLRDKTRGRIYRIVYKGTKQVPAPRLDRAGPRELVVALKNDNLWWRQTAQRLLVERGKTDIVPDLSALVRDPEVGSAGVHALWTLRGLGAINGEEGKLGADVRRALRSRDAATRRAALGLLPRNGGAAGEILSAHCLADDDAHVRLDALLALAEMPGSKESAQALVAFLLEPRNATDRWIPTAAVAAAARAEVDFLEAAAAVGPKPGANTALAEAARVVAGHVARQGLANAAGRLLKAAASGQPAVTEAILNGLAKGWPPEKTVRLDANAEEALKALSEHVTPAGLLQLASLTRRWGVEGKLGALIANVKKTLLARVADARLDDEARAAAAGDLVALAGDADAVSAILAQLTPRASPGLTRGLLEAVGHCASEDVGRTLVERWESLTPSARGPACGLLLRRPAWTRALLAALEEGRIDKAELSVEQAQLLSKHPDAAIAGRATKLLAGGGRLPNPDRQKVLDTLLPLAKREGDKARGKEVFEANCAKCHRHGSLGQSVGPDLTGMATRGRADVLTDILDPNRSVEGNYRQYTVETKRGVLLTGLLTSETKTAVELLDTEAKKHTILREDMESITASKLSLMPEGFEKLPEADLVSLLDFLTAHDRYLPLPLGKAATVTSVRGMFVGRDNDVERLVFPNWGPQRVDGVPFQVIDPRGGSIPNAVVLHSRNGAVAREMPNSVSVPCNVPAKAIHLLSGVAGWAFPFGEKGTVSMIVRIHYADGKSEEHPLRNGVHFADYIRVVDVPGSKLAFRLRAQQIRFMSLTPKRAEKIDRIEFVKGPDDTAPVVMGVTVERLP